MGVVLFMPKNEKGKEFGECHLRRLIDQWNSVASFIRTVYRWVFDLQGPQAPIILSGQDLL